MNTKGLSVASMVLGIVSIVLAFVGFFIASIILEPIALVCGILGIVFAARCFFKQERGGLAITGLVTSIIGTLLAFIGTILAIIAVIAVGMMLGY